MASERRLRRNSSASKTRPGVPKRSTSLRRAYNYIFGAESSTQGQEKQEQAETKPEQQPPAARIGALESELTQCRAELEEARGMVLSQDGELSELKQRSERLEADAKTKEREWVQQKKVLEERMVTVVVQQIKDARKTERGAVKAECEREHQATVVSLSDLYLFCQPGNLVNVVAGGYPKQTQVAHCVYIAGTPGFQVHDRST
jgi:hypothetical protein